MRSSKLKHACCSKFWIEYTDIGRKCCRRAEDHVFVMNSAQVLASYMMFELHHDLGQPAEQSRLSG